MFGDDMEVFTLCHSFIFINGRERVHEKSVSWHEEIFRKILFIIQHWNEMGALKWNAFLKQAKFVSYQKSHGNWRRTKSGGRQNTRHRTPAHPHTRPPDGVDNDDDGVIWCRHRNFQEVTNCQLKSLNLLRVQFWDGTFAWDVCVLCFWNYFIICAMYSSRVNNNNIKPLRGANLCFYKAF